MLRDRLGANVGVGRPIALALPGAVLTVVAIALVALLPAHTEAANPPNPLEGNASWVWYVHAVKAAQREAGLKATGTVDQPTWLELLEGKPEPIDWSERGRPSAFRDSAPRQRADEIPPPAERTG